MALITLGSIKQELVPGLAAAFCDWMVYGAQWKDLFKTYVSGKTVEKESELRTLPMAQFKADGGPIIYGDMGDMFVTSYFHRNFGIGYQITANAISDNLYKDEWPRATVSMKDSLMQCKNVEGAAVFNNAFNPLYPVSDGLALCSTVHIVTGNTSANTFNLPVQFQEAALEDALIGVQKFLNAAGLRIGLQVEKLVGPPELQFDFDRVVESKYRTGTANNDISATYNRKAVPYGYVINQFFTNPTAWFLLTNEPNGFKYYERDPLSIDMFTDATNRNLNVTACERYSFGSSNWRCVYGTQGA